MDVCRLAGLVDAADESPLRLRPVEGQVEHAVAELLVAVRVEWRGRRVVRRASSAAGQQFVGTTTAGFDAPEVGLGEQIGPERDGGHPRGRRPQICTLLVTLL